MDVKSSIIESDYVDLVNESSDSDSDQKRHDGNEPEWSSSIGITCTSHSGVPEGGKKLGVAPGTSELQPTGRAASASWSSSGSVGVASWGSSSFSGTNGTLGQHAKFCR